MDGRTGRIVVVDDGITMMMPVRSTRFIAHIGASPQTFGTVRPAPTATVG